MKLPIVTRTKYNRQIGWAKLWEETAKRVERENAELRELLRVAERKLARFERRRGEGGKFEPGERHG